ncbi:hypothetical protein AVDCRST_MAG94-1106, partial [uncultured Leptolyngbya sp.]
ERPLFAADSGAAGCRSDQHGARGQRLPAPARNGATAGHATHLSGSLPQNSPVPGGHGALR